MAAEEATWCVAVETLSVASGERAAGVLLGPGADVQHQQLEASVDGAVRLEVEHGQQPLRGGHDA